MAEVRLDRVRKSFGSFEAVKGVDVTIGDSEFLVVVGPSGCGKSTLLRLIAGLEELSGGDITISGRLVNDVEPKDRDIAMVFQNYALYPHMTVFDNMAYGLKIRRLPKAEIRERVGRAAAILQIESLLERQPRQLSGGQRQRVAMGRAIVRNPSVFLFDEPLSNLDAKLRVEMRVEIRKLHNTLKTTSVYVTHDQVEAMTLADRIVIMNGGIAEQIGTPLDLYERPSSAFVAGFIGSPPMNFMTVKVSEEGGKIVIDEGNYKVIVDSTVADNLKPYVGKEVVFGTRPEDLQYDMDAKDGTCITTTVQVVEPLGAEIHIYVDTGSHVIIARTPPTIEFSVGDEARFVPVWDRARFFDLESEQAINPAD